MMQALGGCPIMRCVVDFCLDNVDLPEPTTLNDSTKSTPLFFSCRKSIIYPNDLNTLTAPAWRRLQLDRQNWERRLTGSM